MPRAGVRQTGVGHGELPATGTRQWRWIQREACVLEVPVERERRVQVQPHTLTAQRSPRPAMSSRDWSRSRSTFSRLILHSQELGATLKLRGMRKDTRSEVLMGTILGRVMTLHAAARPKPRSLPRTTTPVNRQTSARDVGAP